MSFSADSQRYDGRMPYRTCGRSGLKLPAISLGLWHNFGDATPLETQRRMLRTAFDLGITHFAALSTGEFIDNPRKSRKAEKKLTKLQTALSRKKRGSHRRNKAVQAVAKAHRKIRKQRADFLHTQSRKLVNRFQVIAFEDLQIDNLLKRPKPKQDEDGTYLPNGAAAKAGLNKSISDAGWGQFIQYCTYKAAWAGRTVVQVDPKYTSQICSGCGAIVTGIPPRPSARSLGADCFNDLIASSRRYHRPSCEIWLT